MRRILLVGIAAVALASPASADAARACWKDVLADQLDGRLDRSYPVRCYGDALVHLPADVEAYTSAPDDIRRALLGAVSAKGGGKPPKAGEATLTPVAEVTGTEAETIFERVPPHAAAAVLAVLVGALVLRARRRVRPHIRDSAVT